MNKNFVYKILILFIVIIITFLLGFYFSHFLNNWDSIKNTFWEIKFIDFFEVIIMLITATIITYLISNKLNSLFKRKELILTLIDNLQKELNNLFNNGYSYMHKCDKCLEGDINRFFTSTGSIISLIKKIQGKVKDYNLKRFNKSFTDNYFKFKAALTDTPFGTSATQYPLDRINEFCCLYRHLSSEIYLCKIDLFY